MRNRESKAVVLGASIAGLLTARVLSSHFGQVTIVERDTLPDGPHIRKGVPQGAHAHGLLASGYRVIDEYFPGIMTELEQLGAPRGDVTGDFLWFQYGRWKLRHESGLRGITVSRPCLEATVRERVRALPNVTIIGGSDALEPVFDRASGQVTGLNVRRRADTTVTTLNADLTVDASGRGSHSPRWLEDWGFGQPESLAVQINVGYATRVFERRPGDLFQSMGAIVSGTPPKDTRYAAVLAAEGGRWVVTLVGSVGDYPPSTTREWEEFARSLPVPVVYDLVTHATPLTEITTYRFPANQRRLYERMPRFPSGYLVVGDAVCSFNPIYGQGMSVAAMEARALDECQRGPRETLAARFFARASKIVDIPWTIATGEDLRFPQVEGRRPAGFAVVNRYLERVHAAACDDPVVCAKFFDVLNLLAPPPSLMTPRLAWRVLARHLPAGTGSPHPARASAVASV
jgi:2-polyprenyl-6-methoxyphenol hydroxylase-like FAD-dependent oxidoreductase